VELLRMIYVPARSMPTSGGRLSCSADVAWPAATAATYTATAPNSDSPGSSCVP